MIAHSSLKLSDYRQEISLDESSNIEPKETWGGLLRPVLRELGASVADDISTKDALHKLRGVLAPIESGVVPDSLIYRVQTGGHQMHWNSLLFRLFWR